MFARTFGRSDRWMEFPPTPHVPLLKRGLLKGRKVRRKEGRKEGRKEMRKKVCWGVMKGFGRKALETVTGKDQENGGRACKLA